MVNFTFLTVTVGVTVVTHSPPKFEDQNPEHYVGKFLVLIDGQQFIVQNLDQLPVVI